MEPRDLWREKLKKAIALDLPYPRPPRGEFSESHPPPREPPIAASVLFLFGFSKKDPENPHFLITQRSQWVETHKGQMAFPGGKREANETVFEAALRETQEEVGIPPETVELLGELPKIAPLTSTVWVTPVVGILKNAIEEVPLFKQDAEIDAVFWVFWSELLKPHVYRQEKFKWKDFEISTPVFEIGPYKIWGLTGFMIKNFLDRLQRSDMSTG